jgi:hypothetical protein
MSQPEEFMSEPSKVLKECIQLSRSSESAFQIGMLGMALEIISRIKLLESLPVTTEVGRQEAIVCLQTLLTEVGISDLAYDWYERLSEWRRPKFVSDEYEVPDALVSAAEARRDALSQLPSTPELPSARRTPDPADVSG